MPLKYCSSIQQLLLHEVQYDFLDNLYILITYPLTADTHSLR